MESRIFAAACPAPHRPAAPRSFRYPEQPNESVLASGNNRLAVGRHGEAGHGSAMAAEAHEFFAGAKSKQMHDASVTARRHPRSIGAQLHRADGADLPVEPRDLRSSLSIP